MGWFGPKKWPPGDAAALFIREILEDSQRAWPTAREEIRPIMRESLERTPDLLEDNWTAYYFALARLSTEMQAVRNLLPKGVSEAVIASIYSILGRHPDIGETSSGFVRVIDQRWRDALEAGENPMDAIGLTLYEVLDLDQTTDVNGHHFIDPLLLLGLSALPVQMGAGWWKAFLVGNRVT
jgi:hypothetical protein